MPQLFSPDRNATASKLEQLQPANGLTEKLILPMSGNKNFSRRNFGKSPGTGPGIHFVLSKSLRRLAGSVNLTLWRRSINIRPSFSV